jgi:hypothetical protein
MKLQDVFLPYGSSYRDLPATAIAAALAVGISVRTAHAQAAETVAITGVTVTQPGNTGAKLQVEASVTCPVGYRGNLSVYAQQASIGTGSAYVACTGSAQAVTVSVTPVSAAWNGPLTYGVGQVSVGATLVADQYPDYPWFPTVGTVGTFSTP